jgi:hypothetical protein
MRKLLERSKLEILVDMYRFAALGANLTLLLFQHHYFTIGTVGFFLSQLVEIYRCELRTIFTEEFLQRVGKMSQNSACDVLYPRNILTFKVLIVCKFSNFFISNEKAYNLITIFRL